MPGVAEARLRPHRVFPGTRGPVVVAIMDGVGVGRPGFAFDAVARAHTPNLDRLRQGLYAELLAHGTHVGLPSNDDIGNSEVGHMMLGAGRLIQQGPTLINQQIADGSFFKSEALNALIRNSVENDKPLHLMGLLQKHRSVHSHTDHLKAIVKYAFEQGVKKVFVHGLTDGRDDPEGEAVNTMMDVEVFLSQFNRNGRTYRVASGGGRMTITMDRYWAEPKMLELGWKTHVLGEGRQFSSGVEAVSDLKTETGKQDQWLPPFVVAERGEPIGRIRDGDSVIFFNFRGDRALEMSAAFEKDDFTFFDRGPKLNVVFAGMMAYDSDAGIPSRAIVTPPLITGTMGELLVVEGVRQDAHAETQKFGHVTYFFRGNRQGRFDQSVEADFEVQSDPTSTFAARPWMKAEEATTALMKRIEQNAFRFGRINLANGDMVGHTGDFDATVLAMGTVDYQIGRLMRAIERVQGALIVTADHGNADEMVEVDKKGEPIIRDGRPVPRIGHSLSPVPFYVYAPSAPEGQIFIRPDIERPTIRNVAATTLALLGYDRPEHMDEGLIGFGG